MRVQNRVVLLVVPIVVLWFCCWEPRLSDDSAESQLDTVVPIKPTVQVGSNTSSIVLSAISKCNEDTTNNFGRHTSCILLRNAVITHGEVHFDRGSNPHITNLRFPPNRATRHHMKQISLLPVDSLPRDVLRSVEVGYFQSPVSGAHWENAWHTIADFFVMLFHTVQPFMETNPVWFTRTGREQLRKGCSDESSCRSKSLFDPFSKYFDNRVIFVSELAQPIFISWLVVGLNTRCSPIPTENVGSDACQSNLFGVRQTLLRLYGLPTDNVVPQHHPCPRVHIMSRQGEKYRHITPFEEMNSELRKTFSARFAGCVDDVISVIHIGRQMSFADQVKSIANHSVLVAGRGGGTALSIFLPEGGLYVSLSGFDKWSPYRDLIPRWIQLKHIEVSLVHHEDFHRPPQVFGSGKNKYVDPNRAAYLVKPREVSSSIVDAIAAWRIPRR